MLSHTVLVLWEAAMLALGCVVGGRWPPSWLEADRLFRILTGAFAFSALWMVRQALRKRGVLAARIPAALVSAVAGGVVLERGFLQLVESQLLLDALPAVVVAIAVVGAGVLFAGHYRHGKYVVRSVLCLVICFAVTWLIRFAGTIHPVEMFWRSLIAGILKTSEVLVVVLPLVLLELLGASQPESLRPFRSTHGEMG